LCAYINRPVQHKTLVQNSYGGREARKGRDTDHAPQDVVKLGLYAQIFPGRLKSIADFLEECIMKDWKLKKYGHVRCGSMALQQLMEFCPEHGLNASAIHSSVIRVIHLLLTGGSSSFEAQGMRFLDSCLWINRPSLTSVPYELILEPLLSLSLRDSSNFPVLRESGPPNLSVLNRLIRDHPQHFPILSDAAIKCITHHLDWYWSLSTGKEEGASSDKQGVSEEVYELCLFGIAGISSRFKSTPQTVWRVLEPITDRLRSKKWNREICSEIFKQIAKGLGEKGFFVILRGIELIELYKDVESRISLCEAMRLVLLESRTYQVSVNAYISSIIPRIITAHHVDGSCPSVEERDALFALLELYCEQSRTVYNMKRVQMACHNRCKDCFTKWKKRLRDMSTSSELCSRLSTLASTVDSSTSASTPYTN